MPAGLEFGFFFWPYHVALVRAMAEAADRLGYGMVGIADTPGYAIPLILLRVSGERHRNEAESENDREPDPPHGHLGGGWLAGA